MHGNDPKPSRRAFQYRIRIAEHLDAERAEWFEEMSVTHEENGTVLTGFLPDQAALHGLLKRVRDLGLVLVSVERIPPGGETKGEAIES